MKIKLFFIIFFQLLFCACINNIPGEYYGEIPSGPNNIKINLTLNPDNSLKIKMIYSKDEKENFEEDGTYLVNSEKIITLRYTNDGIKYLKQKDNKYLYILNTQKQIITGPQKNSFLLKKVTNIYF